MKVFKLVVAYDGTDFRGWQRQPTARTVQGALEDALFRVTQKRVAVHGAGRTDAGVHAAGQVASFRAAPKLDDAVLLRALNAVLPDDVRVLTLDAAPPDFHARRSACSKAYEYRVVTSRLISPFDFRFALHVPAPLNIAAMRRAAALFVREADFSAFTSNREYYPVRRVTRSEFRRRGDVIVYAIEADGFLQYMVRTIVGTLLEVGRGKLPPEAVETIFAARDRGLAGPTAPAKGLSLVRVDYGGDERRSRRSL